MALGRRVMIVLAGFTAAALGISACSGSTTGPSGGSSPSSAPAPQPPLNVLDILPPGNP